MKVLIPLFFILVAQSLIAQDAIGCLFPHKVDKKWGFMDDSENLKIPYRFDSLGDFSEGLALAQQNGLWGLN